MRPMISTAVVLESAFGKAMIGSYPSRIGLAETSEPAPDRYLFGPDNNHEIRVASSIEDRRKAWGLVYDEYRKKGYAEEHPDKLWYGFFDALPETTTFLAEKDGEPVGAMTVVFDGPMRLPADALFPEELDALRRQGRRLCEIISLAHGERTHSLLVLKHMFKLAYITARCLEKATDFIITCTPSHGTFYERQLLFTKIGNEREYGKVNGTIGIMLKLDLLDAKEAYRRQLDNRTGTRNMYQFFISRIPELRQWLKAARHPLDFWTVQSCFLDRQDLLMPVEAAHLRALYTEARREPPETRGTPRTYPTAGGMDTDGRGFSQSWRDALCRVRTIPRSAVLRAAHVSPTPVAPSSGRQPDHGGE